MSPIDTFYAQIIIHFMFKTMKLTFFFLRTWNLFQLIYNPSEYQGVTKTAAVQSMQYALPVNVCVCAPHEWMNEWMSPARAHYIPHNTSRVSARSCVFFVLFLLPV